MEVFEPVTDRNDDAVAAVLARLPAPAAAQALIALCARVSMMFAR